MSTQYQLKNRKDSTIEDRFGRGESELNIGETGDHPNSWTARRRDAVLNNTGAVTAKTILFASNCLAFERRTRVDYLVHPTFFALTNVVLLKEFSDDARPWSQELRLKGLCLKSRFRW
jgi:hypothetical protein